MTWWKEWRDCREPEVPALWAAGTAEAFLALLPALLHLALFDWAVPSGNAGNLLLVLVLLLGAEILTALAGGLGDWVGGLRAERVEARKKQGLLERVFRWPQVALDGLGYGTLMKGFDDAVKVTERSHALGAVVANALPAVLMSVPLMFLVSWPLALLRLALLPLNWKLGGAFLARDRALEKVAWEKSRIVQTRVQEAFDGLKTLKVNGAVERSLRDTAVGLLEVREAASLRRGWHSIWAFSAQTLAQAGSVMIFFTAAFLIASGHLSFGRFLAFQVLGAHAVLGIGNLLGVGKTLQQTKGPLNRFLDLMEQPLEKRLSPVVYQPDRPPLVQMQRVRLVYPSGTTALDGVNLTVWPGERLAIAGASGCGKTSLIQVLLAFYPATSGRVLWDGVPYSQYAPDDIRKQAAAVMQDNAMFSGSIRRNLTLGDLSMKDRDLEEALERAGLLDTVRELPEGLDTVYGPDGVRLSGGQRQRLALARAFLRRPRLLVLDEATSALDPLTETLVRDSLRAVDPHTAVVTVAHRLATIKEADCIYVMHQGRIVEAGSHETLVNSGGTYAQLHSTREEAPVWN